MKELYYFSAQLNNDSHECIFSLENNTFCHILVRELHASGGRKYRMETPFVECELEEDEDIKEALFKRGKIFSNKRELKDKCSIRKIENFAGNYHYRISRPLFKGKKTNVNRIVTYEQNRTIPFPIESFDDKDYNQSDIVEIYSGINQLTILIGSLNEIFKTIHPSEENFAVFGDNIRNLLILSCTEVEAQLKGIVKNNILKTKSKYSTRDYVKLKEILRLDEYVISYTKFPWLLSLNPFKEWSAEFPTKSLSWYNNYNSVKHDREREFH